MRVRRSWANAQGHPAAIVADQNALSIADKFTNVTDRDAVFEQNTHMKNAFWVLSPDPETTQLRSSKCFYDPVDAEEYLPWYRERAAEEIWKSPAILSS